MRFPEFSGEWKLVTLKEVADFANGKAHEDSVSENGKYILINSKFISTEGNVKKYTDMQLSPLYKSQIVMVMSDLPNGKALAKCYYINEDNKYTLNQRICSLTPTCCDSLFLLYQINRNKYYLRFDDGVNQTNLKKGEVLNCPVYLPSSNEQQKISALLSLLDQRIETQRKIIEKYESLIRGLCEKLTRRETPNKTIAECLECHSSTLQESSVLDAGNYPVYGAIGICGHIDTPDVSGNGILIIKDGASVGVTYFADGSYSFIGTLNRLTAKEDINLRYVYYCLKVLNFTPYKTGLAIPHIYFKDYGKHKIWCPTLEQQSSIADALTTIDNKILVEKSLLEQLNSQKRYMLKQMFI